MILSILLSILLIGLGLIHFNWVVNSERFGSQFRIEKLSSVDSVWREIAVLSSRKNHSDIHKYEFSSINIIRSAKESFKLIRIDSLNNETELDSLDIFSSLTLCK